MAPFTFFDYIVFFGTRRDEHFMKTHSIRLTPHEYEIARSQAKANSLNVADIARLVIVKIVRANSIPAEIQKITLGERGKRTERLNFKLDADLAKKFKALIDAHVANISMSDVFRFYMNAPEQLFSKPTKRAKARIVKSATAKARDFYQTPVRVVQRFLEAHMSDVDVSRLAVLEPCAGQGAITGVLEDHGFGKVTSIDKYFIEPKIDFLNTDIEQHDLVITNPPYSSCIEFVERSLSVAPVGAFLLPLDYLHGGERYERLFSSNEFHCSTVYVLVKRPTFTQDPQPELYATGQITFAWFVFERGKAHKHIEIKHINNDDDIRRAKAS